MQILEYLEAYTEHFGFGKGIIFRTEVVSLLPLSGGGFTVTTKVRIYQLPGISRGAVQKLTQPMMHAGLVCLVSSRSASTAVIYSRL